METRPSVKFPFYAKLALVLLSIVLVIFLMYEGHTILIPLFFSVLLALLLLPLTKWFQRRGLGKGLAAIISLLIFVVCVGLLFFFLGSQVASFSKDIPLLNERMNVWILELEKWIEFKFNIDPTQQMSYLTKASADIARVASIVAQGVFLTTGSVLIWTIFVFIFSFFMLTHRNLLRRFFLMLFKNEHHDSVQEVLNETRTLVNGYILGLIIEMGIVATLSSIAFLLFGIKYAIMLGIICGLLNVIPYIGIYSAITIGSIITLSNNTPVHALYLIVISIVIHFIDANIIMPRIVGGRVQMNPLITIMAVITGSMIWGIAGMFLFIPLVAIMKIIFGRVDGLKPWAVLMGADEEEKKSKKKIEAISKD